MIFMANTFKNITSIRYEGPHSKNPLINEFV